jgi:hypothetical protein
MPTEPRRARKPLRAAVRAALSAAIMTFGLAGAQAQIGIIGPSAPAPEYVLLNQNHPPTSCSAPPSVNDRGGRRGQEANPGGVTEVDSRTGAPCPPK